MSNSTTTRVFGRKAGRKAPGELTASPNVQNGRNHHSLNSDSHDIRLYPCASHICSYISRYPFVKQSRYPGIRRLSRNKHLDFSAFVSSPVRYPRSQASSSHYTFHLISPSHLFIPSPIIPHALPKFQYKSIPLLGNRPLLQRHAVRINIICILYAIRMHTRLHPPCSVRALSFASIPRAEKHSARSDF